ncbi:hypothetical protein CQA88_31780, partial [Klebsiella pneumoniae]
MRVLHERSLQSLPWRELGVDVVLDCTGVYDTSHGRFAWEVRQERDQLFVGDDAIRVLHERSLQSLPWRELGVDVVLDCTGVY